MPYRALLFAGVIIPLHLSDATELVGHIQLIFTRLAMIFLQCLQGNRPDPARIRSLPSRREASSAVCGRRRWRPWPKRQDMWRKLRLRSCFVGVWDGFGRFSDQKPWWKLYMLKLWEVWGYITKLDGFILNMTNIYGLQVYYLNVDIPDCALTQAFTSELELKIFRPMIFVIS